MSLFGGLLGGIVNTIGGGILGNIFTPKGTNAPKPGEQAANQLQEWELNALRDRFPELLAALDRAHQNLSVSGSRGIAEGIASRRQRGGAETGRANAVSLGRRGYASSVQDSAITSGRNQGNIQGNDALMQLLSPAAQAANAQQQAGLYTKNSIQGGGMSNVLGLQQQQMNQNAINQSKPPSLFESLLMYGGQVAPLFMQQNQVKQNTQAGQSLGNVNWGSLFR